MKIAAAALCVVSLATAIAQPPPACSAAEFRQFDFWLGKWTVRKPDGGIAGTSEITRASEGCALREEWTSARGTHGMSLNFYDAKSKQWQQHWVGGDGQILDLRGGLADGVMLLGNAENRITWTPLPDGTVKQEWSVSTDGGKTWKTNFVGLYERR